MVLMTPQGTFSAAPPGNPAPSLFFCSLPRPSPFSSPFLWFRFPCGAPSALGISSRRSVSLCCPVLVVFCVVWALCWLVCGVCVGFFWGAVLRLLPSGMMVSCTAPDRSYLAPSLFPGCSQPIAAKWVAVPSALSRFRCLGCSSCNVMESTITYLLVVCLQVIHPGAVISALYCVELGDSYHRRIFVSSRDGPDVFSFVTELAE